MSTKEDYEEMAAAYKKYEMGLTAPKKEDNLANTSDLFLDVFAEYGKICKQNGIGLSYYQATSIPAWVVVAVNGEKAQHYAITQTALESGPSPKQVIRECVWECIQQLMKQETSAADAGYKGIKYEGKPLTNGTLPMPSAYTLSTSSGVGDGGYGPKEYSVSVSGGPVEPYTFGFTGFKPDSVSTTSGQIMYQTNMQTIAPKMSKSLYGITNEPIKATKQPTCMEDLYAVELGLAEPKEATPNRIKDAIKELIPKLEAKAIADDLKAVLEAEWAKNEFKVKK